MNRLELNNALWDLVKNQNIPESCELILAHRDEIPRHGLVQRMHARKGKDQTDFVGHTDLGNIHMKDEKPKEIVETHGRPIARIGHFKVWRERWEIHFRYFEGTDFDLAFLEDEDGAPEEYVIESDRHGRLKAFGIMRTKVVARFLKIFCIEKNFLDCAYGKSTMDTLSFGVKIVS